MSIPVTAAGGGAMRAPQKETFFRSIPISQTREIRVFIVSSGLGQSVKTQQFKWDDAAGTMTPSSAAAFVFDRTLPAFIKALVEARDAMESAA